MNENSNDILNTVSKHLERITRFEAKDLQLLKPEENLLLPVTLELSQSVTFSIKSQQGAASLPSSVVKVPDKSTLNEISLDVLALARHQAPDAVQDWVAQDDGAYRRLMPVLATFRDTVRAHGYEHPCLECNGACTVVCRNCSGSGDCSCSDCSGTGKRSCYSCHGSRQTNCGACNGRGRWTELNGSAGPQQKQCNVCTGSGKAKCTYCDYDGKIRCQSCTGTGSKPCKTCGRTGRVNCRDCSASGIQHESQIVAATVDVTENLNVVSNDQKLLAVVHSKIDLDALQGYGRLLKTQSKITGTTIVSIYDLELLLCQADIQAASKHFLIYGFGSNKSVVDFSNIAGELLEGDLKLLEASTLSASRWSFERQCASGVRQ
jgi:hypothetical protein